MCYCYHVNMSLAQPQGELSSLLRRQRLQLIMLHIVKIWGWTFTTGLLLLENPIYIVSYYGLIPEIQWAISCLSIFVPLRVLLTFSNDGHVYIMWSQNFLTLKQVVVFTNERNNYVVIHSGLYRKIEILAFV